MSYPGNPSLSGEIQQRIAETFEQTRSLASEGKVQEALLGCDFVLSMDPQFEPARRLLEKLQGNPAADGSDQALSPDEPSIDFGQPGEDLPGLEIDDPWPHERMRGPDAPAAEEGAGVGGSEDDLLETPRFDDEGGGASPPADAAPTAGGDEPDPFAAAMQDLYDSRQDRRLVKLAEERKTDVSVRPAIRKLVQAAQERIEAEHFVSRYADEARDAARSGDLVEANRLLANIKKLDPTHPVIEDLSRSIVSDIGDATNPVVEPEPAPVEPPALETFLTDENIADEPEPKAVQAIDEPDFGTRSGLEPLEPTGSAAATGAPAGSGGDDAGSTPSFAVDPSASDEERIQALLDEGQAALDRKDHQGAIDAWSRIFLIDIDHDEATRRIEEARQLRAEGERRVEEVFHDAVAAAERGDREAARAGLLSVLEAEPGHAAARDYLETLDRAQLAVEHLLEEDGEAVEAATEAATEEDSGDDDLIDLTDEAGTAELGDGERIGPDTGDLSAALREEPEEELKEEILVPPDPGEEVVRGEEETPRAVGTGFKVVASGRSYRSFLLIGGIVLVAVLGLGWLALRQWDQWFPNSTEETGGVRPSIARATELRESGKTGAALRVLGLIEEGDPEYERAQQLTRAWSAPDEPPAEADELPPASSQPLGPTPRQWARYDEHVETARRALAGGENLRAVSQLRRAAEIAPLDETGLELEQRALEQLEPLQQEIDLFRQHEWEFILNDLWVLHRDYPNDLDVVQLIVDSYYNLGVRYLQRGDAEQALRQFEEAASLHAGDPELNRHLAFARTYERRQKDLLYRIYVKYLQFR